MSGRIAVSQIPIRSHVSLPPDAKESLIRAKNDLRSRIRLVSFGNQFGRAPGVDGPPLPAASNGCEYLEVRVGQDREGQGGVKRLVLEVNTSSWQVMEVYYTEDHYAKFTFFRIK